MRGKSVASITASVSAVFITPSSNPLTITTTISAGSEPINTPSSARQIASAPSIVKSTGRNPKRRVSMGATSTEVIASASPQPKNTSPSSCAPNAPIPAAFAAASMG